MSVSLDQLTPNQLAKRQVVVDAAREVLAREGLAAGTARGIAAASPLTKSAIHYYFADIDELVDEAMAEHIAAFVSALGAVGSSYDDPDERLWATVEAYLETFDAQPAAGFLWFEYTAAAARRDRVAAVAAMLDQVRDLLSELLAPLDERRALDRANVLFSYLLGSVLRQQVAPRSFRDLRPEIEAALCL